MSYFFQSGGFDFPNKSRNVIIGGWKELGRTTLGSASTDITVSSLANKRYLMVITHGIPSGNQDSTFRLNSDTAGNYAYRHSDDGTGESTGVSSTFGLAGRGNGIASDTFNVGFLSNFSTKEKEFIGWGLDNNLNGSGNAPNRREVAGKWANTTDAISAYIAHNLGSGGGQYATNSEVVVLGYDPSDAHTTNFWEELASVNASGSSTNLSSGIITAKKYLWIQAWLKNTTSHTTDMTFNNDTTTYAWRNSDNGGGDSTTTSDSNIELYPASTTPIFVNMFIINNSANEKLVIGHTVQQNTAGAGTAPSRREFVGKYDSTAAQITEIDLDSSSGNWDSSSIIKVWGSN